MRLLKNEILEKVLLRRTKVQQADVLALPPRYTLLVLLCAKQVFDFWDVLLNAVRGSKLMRRPCLSMCMLLVSGFLHAVIFSLGAYCVPKGGFGPPSAPF